MSLKYEPASEPLQIRFFSFDKNVAFYSVKRRNCELSKGGQVIRYRISEDEMVWGKQLLFVQW